MDNNDVIQVRVGSDSIGIIGLKSVMADMAPEYAGRNDEEIGEELLKRLSKRNYMPAQVQESYKAALLREFKKFLGQPVQEEGPGRLEIKVLGPGCARCDRLEQELMELLSETGIVADIQHVRDVREIGTYGVMGTPALIINKEVKAVGTVPPKSKLVQWLKEARDPSFTPEKE